MDNVLEISELFVNIKRKEILSGITINIPEKQIVGFLGPNGAGKTTTVRTCAGLLKKKGGRIKCNNYDLDHDYEKYMKNLSISFDKNAFYSRLSGLENIMQSQRIYGTADHKRISECVDMVGLSKRINDKVGSYSFGMKQRLSLATSILHKAKIIILDEPLNGIDPEGVAEIRKIILNMKKEMSCSFLISSHMLKEIEAVSDRIIMIRKGKIVDDFLMEESNYECHIISVLNELSRAVDILNKNGFQAESLENNALMVSGMNTNVSNLDAELPRCLKLLTDNNIQFSSVKSERNIERLYHEKVGGEEID